MGAATYDGAEEGPEEFPETQVLIAHEVGGARLAPFERSDDSLRQRARRHEIHPARGDEGRPRNQGSLVQTGE